MNDPSSEVRHVVAWLPPVRWATVAAIWTVLASAWLFPHLNLSLRAIVPLGLMSAICRTAIAAMADRRRAIPPVLQGLSSSADAVLMTGLLDITGGPFNPFIVMFLVYVWQAAVSGSGRWGVVAALVSIAGFGWLVIDHVSAEVAEHHRLNDFPTHLFAMWFSGAAIAELVAHYMAHARAALAERQRQVDEARDRALRSEHLAALTTLAAGAAHELSTPLATIAVAARELERDAERLSRIIPPVDALSADARLIRTEVDRCQVILDGMSGRAPDGSASSAAPLPPVAIVELVRTRLTEDQQRRLRVNIEPAVEAPAVAGAAMVQAVSSLLRNAFDASRPGGEVRLRFEQRAAIVRIEVQDHGEGMAPEVLRRAGEPFYTTKPTGRGLGLGLFLTRNLAERSGGALHFETLDGTTAVLELPAASGGDITSR